LETGTGLASGTHIKRDSNATQHDINVGANSFPFINDWNADGKKDLIIGQQDTAGYAGAVRVYLNTGTNAAPRFATSSWIVAGTSPIRRYRCCPVVYDLDGDGLKDLMVGGYYPSYVFFYKNVGTNAAPRFNAPYETLKTVSGTALNVGGAIARIAFIDWRGDGDLDLLISTSSGYVQLCENATVGIEAETKKSLVADAVKITPNPARGRVAVDYSLKTAGLVEVSVYSTDGRLVAKPMRRFEKAGSHRFGWDVGDLPAGVYMVRMKATETITTERLVVAH
jgi:hypothetical protein